MIGHIQPGMGLGTSASKEIAFGLGTPFVIEVIVEEELREVIWLTTFIKRTINLETPI